MDQAWPEIFEDPEQRAYASIAGGGGAGGGGGSGSGGAKRPSGCSFRPKVRETDLVSLDGICTIQCCKVVKERL